MGEPSLGGHYLLGALVMSGKEFCSYLSRGGRRKVPITNALKSVSTYVQLQNTFYVGILEQGVRQRRPRKNSPCSPRRPLVLSWGRINRGLNGYFVIGFEAVPDFVTDYSSPKSSKAETRRSSSSSLSSLSSRSSFGVAARTFGAVSSAVGAISTPSRRSKLNTFRIF